MAENDPMAPDALLADRHTGDKTCADHAQDRATEYAAQIRFLGLLAGIGDETDVQKARDAVSEAISQYLTANPDDASMREKRDTAYREMYETAQANRIDGYYLINPQEYYQPVMSRDPSNKVEAFSESARRYVDAEKAYNEVGKKRAREEGAAWIQGWKDYYNNISALIKQDRWGTAVCMIGVDLIFAVTEEIVIWGATAALAAAGSVAGAVLVRVTARVTKYLSKSANVFVKASRTRSLLRDVQVATKQNDVKFFREIDTATELKPHERKLLGEGPQGTTRPGEPEGAGTGGTTAGDKVQGPESTTNSQISASANNGEIPPSQNRLVPRTREQLLPNGKVPSDKKGLFQPWFDDLSPQELNTLWADDAVRAQIEAQIRSPRGLHEWLMTSRAPKMKELGFSMDDVKRDRPKTSETGGINPEWRHGGTGSTTAHNEILKIIDSAKTREELLLGLNQWADTRMIGGRAALPSHLQVSPQ